MPSLDPQPMASRDIADRFARDGYVFPVGVLSPDQAAAYQRDLEALEQAGAYMEAKGRKQSGCWQWSIIPLLRYAQPGPFSSCWPRKRYSSLRR